MIIIDTKEIWKDIEGYENYYQISNKGNVKSLDRLIIRNDCVKQFRKGNIKTLKNNSDGYSFVTLSKNGIDKTIAVHILVAKHFIPNPQNFPEVNHKDCDRKNNSVENLEWITHKDNVHYAIEKGKHVCTRDLTGSKNPNFHNTTLKIKYATGIFNVKDLARPGAQNGRARPITVENIDGSIIKNFDWIGGCVEWLIDNKYTSSSKKYIRDQISKSIKNNKPYLGFYFK